MKKILGLDLGSASIGWALVNEAENEQEKSEVIKLGVRTIQYDNFVSTETGKESKEPEKDFLGGKGISPNAGRTKKRTARRNLQRHKLRRDNLIEALKTNGLIQNDTLLSENNNSETFITYRLRSKAAVEKIQLEDFARVLLMINKKRGYKSSRKAKSQDEGQLIDGMAIAKQLYDEKLTPGELCLQLIKSEKKHLPDFYRSDLQNELNQIWNFQKQFHPNILTDDFKTQITEKGKKNTAKIFLGKYKIYTVDNKGKDKRLQAFQWRVNALTNELNQEELAFVISEVNGEISNSSGYLGDISDRSKELYFKKITVGQYLMNELDYNPHYSLKNKIFYRQDYLDEFEQLWNTQAQFYTELTNELKKEIRDIIIFHQRPLKSQKGLISFCEFESKKIEVIIDGKKKIKTTGSRVCPRSSPLFQEFKIWQILNNIEIKLKETKSKRIKVNKNVNQLEGSDTIQENLERRFLTLDEKQILFKELSYREKISKEEALKLLFENHNEIDLNYKSIEGNKTQASLLQCYINIIEQTGHDKCDFSKMNIAQTLKTITQIFTSLGYSLEYLDFSTDLKNGDFEKQPLFKLWHLLYSYEGDKSQTGNDSLIEKIQTLFGFEKEYAAMVANISLQDDYSSLSTKAIRKILPHLKDGNSYDIACSYAGYNHSKKSLTKEEIEQKVLKDKLDSLPKNSLRNPVVEKILNQMVNVVNGIIDSYSEKDANGNIIKHFKFDEIRIELARELKKNADQRADMASAINKATDEHENIRKIIKSEFGFNNVSRNDIIRYKLYQELVTNGYKTLYSNTYIPREKIFSKDFDIEHIIPQAKLFDDSFSNKTLELRSINIEKGSRTAYDFVLDKYGNEELEQYLARVEKLAALPKKDSEISLDSKNKTAQISATKLKKLKMSSSQIPKDFIERDLRETQYIAKKAKDMLLELVKEVVSTSGSITDRLRDDWQLVDMMQELNWDKYNTLGMTEIIEGRDGQRIKRIKDWTKRNDHRHHAMDALTIAFTKRSHIQYLNNLHARSDKAGSIYGIEQKELERDEKGKLRFKSPILPVSNFRIEAKNHLENILISIKARNKVVTQNNNITKKKNGVNKKMQLTPRGQLHQESIYGSSKKYATKEVSVNGSFNEEMISKVAKKKYREALLKRLIEFENNPTKAFTGKNTLEKNPIFLDDLMTITVPQKVSLVEFETIYTIRKEVSPDLNIEKVVDAKIKQILEARLKEYNNDAKKAFSNIKEYPIWLNEAKGIQIKRVAVTGISNAEALHDKKDKNGNLILDENGNKQPVDFVSTGNNHHVAIYRDDKGNLQEAVVSFYEATIRANQGLSIIDKTYNQDKGWQFLFSMKQNEYFIFPNEKTGFNPDEINLLSPINFASISQNLYRIQKIATRDYWFRHHLETKVESNNLLKGITWNRVGINGISGIIKVRVNHIGQIVSIGEY